MQLNIYIPKEKKTVLNALDRASQLCNRPKNELVLEALERYLAEETPAPLGKFSLGEVKEVKRADIYEERLRQ